MTKHPLRYVIATMVVAYGLVAVTIALGKTPTLGLDLQGGISVNLQPVKDGKVDDSVSPEQLEDIATQLYIEMLAAGSRDIGFAGADWVEELGLTGKLVELLDTGLDRVRLVAAAPAELLQGGKLTGGLGGRRVVVASEFERLTRKWIADRGMDARYVRSFGATEVFPPEDADCIVDIAQSGATLAANGLIVFDELTASTTRLYASPEAMKDPVKRAIAEELVLLLRGVLDARKRVMVELNVPADRLEAVIEVLPCMREPTIASLHHGAGFAVKVAVPREKLPKLIVEIKRRGGTDIVVSALSQIVA